MGLNGSWSVVVADGSVIVRSGLAAVLKRLPNWQLQPVEIGSLESLQGYLGLHQPDVLFVNPTLQGRMDVDELKGLCGGHGLRCVAIVCSMMDLQRLQGYDGYVSICDGSEVIGQKLSQWLCTESEEESASEALSQREREIVGCVVRGLTNKAIAEQLFLSVHTVITHRRNIARKLQIHSAAGLTIYAIVNKLVDIEDVKLKGI